MTSKLDQVYNKLRGRKLCGLEAQCFDGACRRSFGTQSVSGSSRLSAEAFRPAIFASARNTIYVVAHHSRQRALITIRQ